MTDNFERPKAGRSKMRRTLGISAATITLVYVALLIPARTPPVPEGANREPFVWDQDELWDALEAQFRQARALGCRTVTPSIDTAFTKLNAALQTLASDELDQQDSRFDDVERRLFMLAPVLGACLDRLPEFIQVFNQMRFHLKNQSLRWDMNSLATRKRMYRLIYGGRSAVEELMLQAPPDDVPSVVFAHAEPSATPMTEILGMPVRSGDLLLSRGSASYSALIARGHDYPGNFSHVAIVHVDEKTGEATVIEADIVGGVRIRPALEFVRDAKLRVLVLRLREDLPQLRTDPLLPHRAATKALQDARARRIPYDLEMNYRDHSRMFCSEVASAAYEPYGITLWTGLSFISGRGVISWLSTAGVRNFETQEPSDLEYDPQLRVVSAWRDRERLFNDHLDNAIIEVMIEDADRGERLTYPWHLLPVVRVMKAYSRVLNALGVEGPVPDAVSPRAALLMRQFDLMHASIKRQVVQRSQAYREASGYTPPYWELLRQVRAVKATR